MRFFAKKTKQTGLSVRAITGTYVVVLGMDMDKADTKDLLGFAIQRDDPKEKETYWLQGMRTFAASNPNPPEGALFSTQEQPIQDFLWSDFTAKPGRKYTYRVTPVRGRPKKLEYGKAVTIDVETETEVAKQAGAHSVFFNRGVIGSQAYARKFKASPTKLQGAEREEAYEWLSRGLGEAIVNFIGEAKGKGWGLRMTAYEFSHQKTAEALAAAKKAGADVKIVYDARVPVSKGVPNKTEAHRVATAEALLKSVGLDKVATGRKSDPSHIAHNKFIVLLKDNVPIAVWTGSTNFTDSGIYGQSNVGHLLRDKAIAAKYFDFWTRLHKDPAIKALRAENEAATPTLSAPPDPGTTPVFSPRAGLDQLSWYADTLGNASASSCFTAAFGVNKLFLNQFSVDKDYLRYVFLEKWGVNKTTAALAEEILTKDSDIQVAVGATLQADVFEGWIGEFANSISSNVKYTHTKFLLVDPLSGDPTVVTGSANFSDASTNGNDENMLIIRGDTRVADIYLGEFMRLWRHHHFRSIVMKVNEETGEEEHNHLDPTAAWAKKFFDAKEVAFRQRTTFA